MTGPAGITGPTGSTGPMGTVNDTIATLSVTNMTDSTSASTGGLIVIGGIGFGMSMHGGNGIESTSTSTGTVVVNGGVGIKNACFANNFNANLFQADGGNLQIYGASSSTQSTVVCGSNSNTSASSIALYGNSVIGYGGSARIITGGTGSIFFETGISSIAARINTSGTVSTSTGTGTFILTGGLGVNGNVNSGPIQSTGSISTTGSTGLPTDGGNSIPWIVGGFANPTVGRIFIGDGTGWILKMSKLQSNVTTDLITFKDDGTMTKIGGSFLIPHPNPVKVGWKLRHCFVETNTRGDNIYRYQVQTLNGLATITLPDYFKYLNENPQVWVSPKSGHGSGSGDVDVDMNHVTIDVSIDGVYNVMVVGTRKDQTMKNYWDQYGDEMPPDAC
jgi:hypothetical protein